MVILLLLWRAEGYPQSAVGHLSPFIHECRTYYLNSRLIMYKERVGIPIFFNFGHATSCSERRGSQFPQFDYPSAIRKIIYTTNAIESQNSMLRKVTKQRKLFPTDESALKVAFPAIQQASKKWTMPIQNWTLALNRFIIEFGDRLNGHL